LKIELGEGEERLYDIVALGALKMIVYGMKGLYGGQEAYEEWVRVLEELEGIFNTEERTIVHHFKFLDGGKRK